MKIELSRGLHAEIDNTCHEALSYKWYAVKCDTKFYAVRTINLGGKKTKKVYLHRYLMGDTDSIIDFINGDTLDCRMDNLRFCNRSEDAKNRNGYGTSKYLGVNFHVSKSKYKNKKGVEKIYKSSGWLAKIKIKEKYKHIGRFKTEIEAAKAYDAEAKKHHKEFANLNFN
jgi:hypothetical protein